MIDPIVEQRDAAPFGSDLYIWQDASAHGALDEQLTPPPRPAESPKRWPAQPDDILPQIPFLQKIGELAEVAGKIPVHADLVRLVSLPNGVVPPSTVPAWFEQFVKRAKHHRDSVFTGLPCRAISSEGAAAQVQSFCAPIRQAHQRLIAARFMWMSLAAVELVVRKLIPKEALRIASKDSEGFISLGNDLAYKPAENEKTIEFVFQGQWFKLQPVQGARFMAAWYIDRAGWSARSLPFSGTPAHTSNILPSLPHRPAELLPPPTTEGPVAANRLEEQIDEFHARVADHLHSWLATLAGQRFETKEAAQQEVDRLMAIVRKAGRQLMFNGQTVAISVTTGTRQQRPTIQLRGRSEGQGVLVFNSVEMPLLSTTVCQPRIYRGRRPSEGVNDD